MKKFTYSKGVRTVLCCLVAPLVFLTSCETEESTDRIGNSDATVTRSASGNCASDCISDTNPYYPTSDVSTVTWGNNFSKTIDIKYYNTATHFVLEVRSSNGWSDLLINGVSVWEENEMDPLAPNEWGTYSYPLPNGWQACDRINFALQVAGNGPSANFAVDYNLIGICDEGCETEFTGQAVSCDDTREAVYTFTADADQDYIKIQGGLTNFTGADAVITFLDEEGNVIDDLDNLTVSQWTPGESSNRVIKVDGSVSACETITIRIEWNSDNGGNVITGDWSVKDENGVELAPSVEGLFCE